MKLKAFLETLDSREIKVTLINDDGTEIIKFYSEGRSGVESDLLDREVDTWSVSASGSISVKLKAASGS